MKKQRVRVLSALIFLLLNFALFPSAVFSQNSSDETEVYLTFRHRGVINSMVTSYYKNNDFYLPVGELFTLFQIDHQTNGLVIEGNYALSQTPYTINFSANTITYGDDTYQLNQDDYLIKDLDNFLHPTLLYEIFGLEFTVDFNNLSLNLETGVELPAIEQQLREQRRAFASRNLNEQELYELRFDRERPFLDGGFVDYNLSGNFTTDNSVFNFNTNLGLQVYGGDLQGIIYGNYTNSYTNLATNNLRWRYRFREKPWLSTLEIGQTATDGIIRNTYTGVRLSNEPIEPRRLFDEFVIQGNTIPQSEIELYLNNALIDFQQADEFGYYRFLAPVSYGTSQINLDIYGPTGQVIEQTRRIQIPFTFQPEGTFNYQINAGQLNNPIFGSTKQEMTAQANGAYGVTNWLTAKAGIEYYEGYHQNLPTFTTTLSSRILSHYLLTLEAASEAFYRSVINVIYPNSASINVDYTDFISGIGIYNPSNDDKRITASAFYPFTIFGTSFNLRASSYSRIRESTNTTTFRVNAGSRIGKLNLRLGYSDRFTNSFKVFNPSATAYIESSATYNISRNRSIPSYLRGVYLRAQMRYFPRFKQVESAEILASQNLFKMGRLQFSYGRNFAGNFNLFRLSLVINFEKVRTSSTFNFNRNNFSSTQNIRGSIGYDTNYHNFIFTSRDQVGRSATAIKLFVDNNADGEFDEGDDSINENAIRIQRSGASSITKNGVLYYTQMQPYFFYNMEVNKGAIRNPMLVPDFERFGLITDPNRFKKIEIPFYMSGVIEGTVEREFSSGRVSGVGGLKLNLKQINGDFSQEIRTFSDGSFYSYEVPPGNYHLSVDSTQLTILDSYSDPDSLLFEVKAIPEGDFVEGLSFVLKPTELPEPDKKAEVLEVTTLEEGLCSYILQLGSFSSEESANAAANLLPRESNPFIIFNEQTNLYAVRVTAYPSLGQASEMVETLYANNYNDVAVLHDCSDQAEGISYDLQIATFNSTEEARNYFNEFRQKYDLEIELIEDRNGLIHVIHASFQDLLKAQERKEKIGESYPDLELHIAKKSPESTIKENYYYLLQLGLFKTERDAENYAKKITAQFQLNANIVVDEKGTIILFVDEPFTRWRTVISTQKAISDRAEFDTPIIHLSEPE